ncbi:hypothetical protein [Sporosarcina cyprini]|uniref:hypothetical protein n=1 Tax=Sporosarcina cyprini TaxID=2910523 RepID=UPI001EDE0391|nr:hypothetical protein [Sporosarcina cyprini]MCG3087895.1 hypothetical protein [Sporosarcina cyprini]
MVSSRSSSGPVFCGDEWAVENANRGFFQRIRAASKISEHPLEQSSGSSEDTRGLAGDTSGYRDIREVTEIYERFGNTIELLLRYTSGSYEYTSGHGS